MRLLILFLMIGSFFSHASIALGAALGEQSLAKQPAKQRDHFSSDKKSYSKDTRYQAIAVPGEIVVKLFSDDSDVRYTLKQKEIFLQRFEELAKKLQTFSHSKKKVSFRSFKTDARFAVLQVSASDVRAAILRLEKDPDVSIAEPNFYFYALDAQPNDPAYASQWSFENHGQIDHDKQTGKNSSDIRVKPVWNEGITGNASIKIAIVDTGIDYRHPDLQKNMWVNTGEIAGNGIDDDGNGFVDDLYGWDFLKNNNNPTDEYNHGSHCAGIIGGTANNYLGVTGINWDVSMISLRFLDQNGSGTLENAAQAIQYAVQMGAQIINNSWGGSRYSQILFDAVENARKHGILMVSAAGNLKINNDISPLYPASFALDNVISVAATDNRDRLSAFSNFGKTTVHVAAPGTNIFSTAMNGGYVNLSGTSMAAPHVSGVAALMLAANPQLTYSEIKSTLIRSSDPIHGFEQRVISHGRVNAYNAIHGIFPVAPTVDESRWVDYKYVAETPHPYANSKTYSYSIQIPKAKYIRIFFETIDTEVNFDLIEVSDAQGVVIETLDGQKTGYVTDYLEGPAASVRLAADSTINGSGFKISKVQAIY